MLFHEFLGAFEVKSLKSNKRKIACRIFGGNWHLIKIFSFKVFILVYYKKKAGISVIIYGI